MEKSKCPVKPNPVQGQSNKAAAAERDRSQLACGIETLITPASGCLQENYVLPQTDGKYRNTEDHALGTTDGMYPMLDNLFCFLKNK